MSNGQRPLLPTEDGGEHRQDGARAPLELKVHVLDEHGRDDLLYSHDWSTHGLFVRTRHPPPPGSIRRIRVSLPGSTTPVELVARVVRVIPFGDPSGHAPGMALHFDEVPRALSTMLTDSLGRLQVPKHLPSPGKAASKVLVVGTPGPARVTLALALDGAGFDVSESDGESDAIRLLSAGYRPQGLVVQESYGSRTVATLLARFVSLAEEIRPLVIVGLGTDLIPEGAPLMPVVLLPDNASVRQVLMALAFAKGGGETRAPKTLAEETLELELDLDR